MFKFTGIQVGRSLSDQEVTAINYIIKSRAYRYIAASEKSWLFPEDKLKAPRWDSFGRNYLLMPDPRSVSFSGEIIIGYKDKRTDSFDVYGRKPWHSNYDDKAQHDREWETFHAFQGEFARLFGPRRRGLSFETHRLTPEVDSDEYHAYHLGLEQKFKKHRYKSRRT